MASGVKISNLSFTNSISGCSLVPIVQDGITRSAAISSIVAQGADLQAVTEQGFSTTCPLSTSNNVIGNNLSGVNIVTDGTFVSGGLNLIDVFNTDSSITLQDVTDNGSTTTNNISSSASLSANNISVANHLQLGNLGFSATNFVDTNALLTLDKDSGGGGPRMVIKNRCKGLSDIYFCGADSDPVKAFITSNNNTGLLQLGNNCNGAKTFIQNKDSDGCTRFNITTHNNTICIGGVLDGDHHLSITGDVSASKGLSANDVRVAEKIEIDSGNPANPLILSDGTPSHDTLKVSNSSGYVQIGAANTSFAHFYTDRAKYYFDNTIVNDSGIYSAYGDANMLLTLGSAPVGTCNGILIHNDTFNVGVNTQSPSAVLTVQGDISASEGLSACNIVTTGQFVSGGQNLIDVISNDSTINLQNVTDNGNTTTNDIIISTGCLKTQKIRAVGSSDLTIYGHSSTSPCGIDIRAGSYTDDDGNGTDVCITGGGSGGDSGTGGDVIIRGGSGESSSGNVILGGGETNQICVCDSLNIGANTINASSGGFSSSSGGFSSSTGNVSTGGNLSGTNIVATGQFVSGGLNLIDVFNTDTSITLQDVTDNGKTTTNSLSVGNSLSANELNLNKGCITIKDGSPGINLCNNAVGDGYTKLYNNNSSVTVLEARDPGTATGYGIIDFRQVNGSGSCTAWKLGSNTNMAVGHVSPPENAKMSVQGNLSGSEGVISQSLSSCNIIGGCSNNFVNGDTSGILGGCNNRVFSNYGAIATGKDNRADGTTDFIGGGFSNYVSGGGVFIGAGDNNCALSGRSAVVAGTRNCINACRSFVGSGSANNIFSLGKYSSIVGGCGNTTKRDLTFIGGGACNRIAEGENVAGCSTIVGGFSSMIVKGIRSFIGGGGQNIIDDSDDSVIAGGYKNCITDCGAGADDSVIGGGTLNFICSTKSVIGGGCKNCIFGNARYGTIAGGRCNFISTTECHATIGGGQLNCVDGDHGTVGGGCANKVFSLRGAIAGGSNNCINSTGTASFIGGGCSNAARSTCSLVVGGCGNFACGTLDAVVGGCCNRTSGDGSTTRNFIGGGALNCLRGTFICDSAIVGGADNEIQCYSCCSFIGGGHQNVLAGTYNIIGGGQCNVIRCCATNVNVKVCYGNIVGGKLNAICPSSNFSTVIGGCCNFIGPGASMSVSFGQLNCITSDCSGILGGCGNCLEHDYSYALGLDLHSNQACTTFVNNLSSQCSIHAGDGANFTGVITGCTLTIVDGIITSVT